MENNKEKQYKLIGVYNCYKMIPDITYPIFMDEEGVYYGAFSVDEKSPFIPGFREFPSKDEYDKVIPISEVKEHEELKEYYQVGDLLVGAFQDENREFYVGRLDKYLERFREYMRKIEVIYYSFNKEAIDELLSRLDFSDKRMEAFLQLLHDETYDCEYRLNTINKAK